MKENFALGVSSFKLFWSHDHFTKYGADSGVRDGGLESMPKVKGVRCWNAK